MKKLLTILILISLVLASETKADQTIASHIKSVNLYLDRALVTREATVKIAPGMQTLAIELQAFRIDPDAVLARVFGKGEVHGVQYREVPVMESPQEGIRVIKKQIEDLEKQKQAALDQKDVLAKQALFLDGLIEFSKTQVPQEMKTAFPKVEALRNTLSFLGSSYQKIYSQQQDQTDKVEAIDRQIDLLQKKLEQLKRPAAQTRKLIEVLFLSQSDQEIRIEADYLALNASWTPMYKASVTDDLDRVDLTMFANIIQKTGENWPQVTLSLSNITPLKGGRLPTLHSWIVDLPRPLAKHKRAYAPSKAQPAMELKMEADEVGLEEEAPMVSAVAHRKPLAFEYALPRPLDIESRDKETIVPLLSKTLEGEFYHFVVPKRTPLTFLVCEARADTEILAGPMNIYLGGQYVGKTRIDSQKAGEAFRLSLGVDRGVMVKREKVSDKIKETYFGAIQRNSVVRSLAYKITVTNQKDRPVKLKLLDHIPIARTDKIEIKDLKMTPPPAVKDYQEREGVMLWEFDLGPQVTRELNIEFVIIYPKDSAPAGL